MPENKTINNVDIDTGANSRAESGVDEKVVTVADVDWIDHYGSALIHGHRFTPADIAEFEHHRDRDHTARLSPRAKARIARILTLELQKRADLWRRAREAYRVERLSEGTSNRASHQGPADTEISLRDPNRMCGPPVTGPDPRPDATKQ